MIKNQDQHCIKKKLEVCDYGNKWLVQTKVDIDVCTFFKKYFEINRNKFFINKHGKSTTGNAKQYWIFYDEKFVSEELQSIQFEKVAHNLIGQIKSSLNFLKLEKPIYDLEFKVNSMWFVEGEENSYQKAHHHEDENSIKFNLHPCGISTVMYLDDDGIGENDEGSIYFIMNSEASNLFTPPNKILTLSPSKGDFYIFPDYLIHGTYPQQKGRRLILSINFILQYHQKIMSY